MSGGTWNYDDVRLDALADQLREPEDDAMELPAARAAMAGLLSLTAEVLHQMDYHISGDSRIDNETAWLLGVQRELRDVIDSFVPGG